MPQIAEALAVSNRLGETEGRKVPLVVTTCSAGKRCRGQLIADDLPVADQSTIARAWVERLRSEAHLTPARDLYRGRSFGLARGVAAELGANLAVFSAGLGYVREDTRIPAYDLTVRPKGPGSVVARIAGSFDADAWWQAVKVGPFSADLLADLENRDLILVCLSRAYAAMVEADLLRVVREAPNALRIFGLSIERSLPAELRPFVMPYDARLEAIGAPGTRVDFPQRSLADYVRHILPTAGTLEAQRLAVLNRLVGAEPPARANRRRVDDTTLKAHVVRLLPTIGSRGSAVLSHLRSVEGISCEQRRFAEVFRAVKTEIGR